MTEPADILERIRYLLAQGGSLRGRKIVVTAGGTREMLDPVRFLSNRSSGKQGYALVQAALDAGADVVLVSAAQTPSPFGARCVSVSSAREMRDAVLHEVAGADALIMAAAVADFRPQQEATHKIKKADGVPSIALTPNPDILLEVAHQRAKTGNPPIVVGFAAESQNLLQNAQRKLEEKGLSLVVANDIGASDAGFAVDTNRVTILADDGSVEMLPLMSKTEVAQRVIDRISERLVS